MSTTLPFSSQIDSTIRVRGHFLLKDKKIITSDIEITAEIFVKRLNVPVIPEYSM